MAVQSLTFEHERIEMAQYSEKGLLSTWFLAADARIKTETNTTGVGPVVYKGPLKNSSNIASKDGYSRDLVIFFYTDTEARRAELWNQEPGDINDTANDFLTNHGASISAMLLLAPSVGE
jgi:hypothetical protein